MMYRGILLIIITVSFLGCAKPVYVPTVGSRSVVDTIVMQESDSAMIRALFECDSAGNVLMKELVQVKGKMANQKFDFSDNQLRIETRWQTKYIERMVERRDTITVVDVRKEVVSKPYIPNFFWGCFVVTILLLIWICFRLFRR